MTLISFITCSANEWWMLGETVLIALIKAIASLALIIDCAYATVIAVFIVYFIAFSCFAFILFNFIAALFFCFSVFLQTLHNNKWNNNNNVLWKPVRQTCAQTSCLTNWKCIRKILDWQPRTWKCICACVYGTRISLT